MKKRIAHIINSNIYSGLENVVCTIMEQLQNQFEMIYVTQDGPIVKILDKKQIPYYIISKMNITEIRTFIVKWNPDILQAHDYTASVICALANPKVPIINHLHNNSPWLKNRGVNSLAYLYAGIKADKILTVSEAIESEYVFSKYIRNKIEVIGNPVSREEVLRNLKECQNKKKYDICCVGRLTPQKNPFRFVNIVKKIAEKYPQIKVVWVGDGELKDEILVEVKRLQLQNNIEFVGFQRNPYQYMNESKVFMLTSSWEGYGLVAFESLTLGLPTVVSNVGGLPNVVDNECGLLCETDNDFIDEIEKLLNCKSYYEQKSRKAVEKSYQLENFDSYILEISNIYKAINEI